MTDYAPPEEANSKEVALWLCSLSPQFPCRITIGDQVTEFCDEQELDAFIDYMCDDLN